MSAFSMRLSEGGRLKNRRVGLLLGAAVVLYIAAVIAFIIVY